MSVESTSSIFSEDKGTKDKKRKKNAIYAFGLCVIIIVEEPVCSSSISLVIRNTEGITRKDNKTNPKVNFKMRLETRRPKLTCLVIFGVLERVIQVEQSGVVQELRVESCVRVLKEITRK